MYLVIVLGKYQYFMFEEIVKVLVVDDTPANVKIIKKFIEPKGYEVFVAENGQQALDMYQSNKPEIVLMDIMMPIMDGYEATQKIREWDDGHWVPLIFLSAKTSIEDQVKAIEMGGDDYLTKPIDLRLLEAKLSAMMRIVKMQRELKTTSQKLKGYVEQAEAELDLAKRLMDNMLQTYTVEEIDNVSRYSVAMKVISGDISIVYKSSSKLYVLLADATGHGLSAAISLIPATQLFYAMVQQEESIGNIVTAINRTLKALLPCDRFVAATIATIDESNQCIEVWNGSNPSPVIVDDQGNLLKTFEQTNFAFGIVSGKAFTTGTEVYYYTQNAELLLYSDGLTELRNEDGNIIGVEGLVETLTLKNDPAFAYENAYNVLLDYIEKFRDEDGFGDDLSLISVRTKIA